VTLFRLPHRHIPGEARAARMTEGLIGLAAFCCLLHAYPDGLRLESWLFGFALKVNSARRRR